MGRTIRNPKQSGWRRCWVAAKSSDEVRGLLLFLGVIVVCDMLVLGVVLHPYSPITARPDSTAAPSEMASVPIVCTDKGLVLDPAVVLVARAEKRAPLCGLQSRVVSASAAK